jgi:hypothetical protein
MRTNTVIENDTASWETARGAGLIVKRGHVVLQVANARQGQRWGKPI